jgi:uncharacterized protein (DUF488 family)
LLQARRYYYWSHLVTRGHAPVYTIGHSTHSIDAFLGLLKKNEVAAIADVRSSPFSKRHPQFVRDALRRSLTRERIAYVFLGAELGGRGIDESVYDERGRVRYGLIAESREFREGLRRVRSGSERMRIALMCAEGEPLECHRGILISRLLTAQSVHVRHIHADGHVEAHNEAERRLLRLTGLNEKDLFRSDEEMLANAYELQEARIAYVKPYVTFNDKALQ